MMTLLLLIGLAAAVVAMMARGVQAKTDDAGGGGEAESAVVQLNSETYEAAVTSNKMYFIKFFAPWCGHCKRLAPTWAALAEIYKGHVDIEIATVDCTVYKDVCTKNEVKGYPTLKLFFRGKEIETYKGPRSEDNLKKFMDGHVQSRM